MIKMGLFGHSVKNNLLATEGHAFDPVVAETYVSKIYLKSKPYR